MKILIWNAFFLPENGMLPKQVVQITHSLPAIGVEGNEHALMGEVGYLSAAVVKENAAVQDGGVSPAHTFSSYCAGAI